MVINPYKIQVSDGILQKVVPLARIEALNLTGLQLRGIAEEAFKNVTYLNALDLSSNSLTHLQPAVFATLGNLESLSLANNNLTDLSLVFATLASVKLLDLSNNKHLKLQKNTFNGLSDNTEILLCNTSIGVLERLNFNLNETWENRLEDVLDFDILEVIDVYGKTNEVVKAKKCYSKNDTNYDRTVMVCIHSGIVQSVELATENLPINCYRFSVKETVDLGYDLILDNDEIAGFSKNWYRLPKDFGVTQLTINGTQVKEINENMLNDLPPCVMFVSIMHSSVDIIKNNVIRNSNILVFEIRDSKIQTIEREAFKNLPSLSHVFVSRINISDMEFVGNLPETVRSLWLHETNTSHIPEEVFVNLIKLTDLHLQGNKIFEISKSTFKGLDNLITLDLERNSIETIEGNTFDNFPRLTFLSLKNNNITVLEKGFANKLNKLYSLDISGNPIEKLEQGIFHGMDSNSEVEFSNVKFVQLGIFKNY